MWKADGIWNPWEWFFSHSHFSESQRLSWSFQTSQTFKAGGELPVAQAATKAEVWQHDRSQWSMQFWQSLWMPIFCYTPKFFQLSPWFTGFYWSELWLAYVQAQSPNHILCKYTSSLCFQLSGPCDLLCPSTTKKAKPLWVHMPCLASCCYNHRSRKQLPYWVVRLTHCGRSSNRTSSLTLLLPKSFSLCGWSSHHNSV